MSYTVATLRDFLMRQGLWAEGQGQSGSAASAGADLPTARGANNAVFRVDVPAGNFLLKQYFSHPDDDRDRLGAEVAFCQFAWRHGIHVPPRFVADSRGERLALFEFIAGRPLTAAEVDESSIAQSLQFCQRLHAAQAEADAGTLPLAAESCFSVQQHLACVDRRVRRLQTIDPESRLGADVLQFVRAGLVPGWEELRRQVLDQCRACRIAPHEELDPADRILSPSDFGFHNALLDREGNVRFFDFEYAGWDDPAKLVCDFFCQVEVPVPRRLYSSFCESIASRLPEPERVRQRIDVLFPVYQLKWCCIVLNEFLPGRPGPPAVQRCVPEARTTAGSAVGKGPAHVGSSGRS